MKESWRYYDFLRRWGLLLLLGLGLGALAGFGFFIQQEQQPRFKANAKLSVFTEDRPGVIGHRLDFNVVSNEFSDPKSAVKSILATAEVLGAQTGINVDAGDISLKGQYSSPVWRTIMLGSVIGGLLVIGATYVWDDALAYMRHRRQNDSKDT